MALQKKLLVCVGTASILLSIYFLCLTLEWPLSMSFVPLRVVTARISSSLGNSTGPQEGENSTHQRLHQTSITATELPEPAQNKTRDVSESRSKSGTPTAGPSRAAGPSQGAGPSRAPGPSRAAGPPRAPGPSRAAGPPRAAGPTEPPFIGDAYISEDATQQTDCPDTIRGRIKTSEFGSRFLERIPVVQWSKHATREQYQRLRQYPGTHGWGGVDYDTLVDTLSVLNCSANRQMLDDWEPRRNKSACSRCAVVGNGGILKNSQKGKEIDDHHFIFRTNGAIIKGFEQDVGSRTTHYIFSTNTLMNSMNSYRGAGYLGPPVSEETRYVFLPDHDRDYLLMKAAATHTPVKRGPEQNKDPLKYFGKDVSAAKLKMFHPDFIRYLRNRFLRSSTLKTRYKDIYRPSTGAAMLLAALHSCDQVSAYGFMTPDYAKYSDHYYDSTFRPVGFFINHDLRMEMALWQQLHRARLIRLYMRD